MNCLLVVGLNSTCPIRSRGCWGSFEHVQTVVQNLFFLEAGGPGVGLWIVEKLTGQVHRTYHDGPGSPLVRKEGFVANAIESGIDLAEVSQMDCFRRMLVLIFAKRDQSLSPIQITITQQFVAGGGIYEDGEVGKVTGGVAQAVGCVDEHQCNQQQLRHALGLSKLPESGDEKQDEGIDEENMSLSNIHVGED